MSIESGVVGYLSRIEALTPRRVATVLSTKRMCEFTGDFKIIGFREPKIAGCLFYIFRK